MPSDTAYQNMMEKLPHYQSKYDAWKQIKVYFIPAFDEKRNEDMFFYAIASSTLHNEMVDSLKKGDIPHFAVIVEKGYGEPTAETKAKIKDYYGFDHDFHAGNDNFVPPAEATGNDTDACIGAV